MNLTLTLQNDKTCFRQVHCPWGSSSFAPHKLNLTLMLTLTLTQQSQHTLLLTLLSYFPLYLLHGVRCPCEPENTYQCETAGAPKSTHFCNDAMFLNTLYIGGQWDITTLRLH